MAPTASGSCSNPKRWTAGAAEAAENMPDADARTWRVGITGHRPNKLTKAAAPRVDRQLHEVFATIDDAAGRSGRGVMLTSGFAEGVDQMAVAAAPARWRVEAILPFPKEEYLKDF